LAFYRFSIERKPFVAERYSSAVRVVMYVGWKKLFDLLPWWQ